MLTETVHTDVEQLLLFQPVHTGRENRKSPRVAADDPALLTVLEPNNPYRINARIMDVSRDGLKLLVPSKLAVHAEVQVHVRDLSVVAEVRYCRPAGGLFYAGIFIQDVFPACG